MNLSRLSFLRRNLLLKNHPFTKNKQYKCKNNLKALQRSIVLSSGHDHLKRTTTIPHLLNLPQVRKIIPTLSITMISPSMKALT